MKTRFSRFVSIAYCAVACLIAAAACGSTFQSGENVHISSLHQIDDDFYAASYDIVVDGVVTGDLVGASNQAEIRGEIGRSVNLGCFTGQFTGTCGGSLRWMGNHLTIGGLVGGSVVAYGGLVIVRPGSVIEKDVDIAAKEMNLDGIIKGNATLREAKTIKITGQIHGDVMIEAEKIILSPPATITGSLVYTADNEDAITIEPGATVVGEVSWQEPEQADEDDSSVLTGLAYKIASLLAAFIFGALMFALFRAQATESFNQLGTRFPAAIAAGLAGLLGLIVAIIILALALIGALAGSILLTGDLPVLGVAILVLSILAIPISSFVTVSGAVALYSGKIVVGLYLGHLILGFSQGKTKDLSKTALFIGLALLTIVAALPYVGTVIMLLTALIGAGAIMLGVHNCRRKVILDPTPARDSTNEGEPKDN